MINTADIFPAQQDMRAKVAWARRALAGMEAIAGLHVDEAPRHVEQFQDHFWSYLSAGESVWFYLNRLCTSAGLSKGTGRRLLKQWRTANLASEDDVLLATLRNADVHTAPVTVAVREERHLLMGPGGGILTVKGGGIAAVRVAVFSVDHDGHRTNCLKFAQSCLPVLERIVNELPAVVAPVTAPSA